MKKILDKSGVLTSVPDFIIEKARKGEFSGNFKSFVFYADITDFTKITESLMKEGKRGAERLSEVLDRFFIPYINAVKYAKGIISCFEGDSFIAVFPETNCDSEEVLREIENAYEKSLKIKPRYLKNICPGISVKAGLSRGVVEWCIVRKNPQSAYIISGEALDEAIEAGKKSKSGKINICGSLRNFGERDDNLKIKLYENPYLLKKRKKIQSNEMTKEMFLSPIIRGRVLKNEFREVINCFISPSVKVSVHGFIEKISKLSDKYGCYTRFSRGDKGVVAVSVFGAPVRLENSSKRACDFAMEFSRGGSYKLGITYGSAFTGIIGNIDRAEYVILGEKVNLAARLMTRAKAGETLVDEDFFEQASEDYSFNFAGKETFKGISEKVKYMKLERKNTEKSSAIKEIVGLESQTSKLKDELAKHSHEKSFRLINVFGEAGTGKSSLIAKVLKELNIENPVIVENLMFNPSDFSLITQFFREVFLRNSNVEKRKAKDFYTNFLLFQENIRSHAVKVKSREICEDLTRLKPVISHFLSVSSKRGSSLNLNINTVRTEALMAVSAVLAALYSLNRNVFVIEDIHNWDKVSVDIFSEIFRTREDFPFCLITSSRLSDDGSKMGIFKNIEKRRLDIHVKRLSARESLILAKKITGSKISKPLLENIFATTQGNPYFLTVYCDFLKKNGYIVKKNREAYLVNKTEKLPGTMNDVVVAKIDRLDGTAKDILNTCSLFRETIDVWIIENVYNAQKEKIPGLLESLSEKGFLSKIEAKQFRFKSDAISKVIGGMMLESEIMSKQRQIARVYIQKHGKNKTYFEVIAHHLKESGDLGRAAEFFEKAGDYAKEKYLYKKAIQMYLVAKSILKNRKDYTGLGDINLKIAIMMSLGGEIDKSQKLLAENIKFLENIFYSGDKNIKILNILHDSYFSMADNYIQKGKLDLAEESAKKSLKLVSESKDRENKIKIIVSLGRIKYYKNEYKKALMFYKKALDLSGNRGNRGTRSSLFLNIGNIHSEKGDFKKALENYKNGMAVAAENNEKSVISDFKFNMAYLYYEKKEYKKALRYFNECLPIYRKWRLRGKLAKVYLNLGLLHQDLKNYSLARKYYFLSLKLNRKIGNPLEVSRALTNIAGMLTDSNEHFEAEEYYKQALEIKEEIGDQRGKGILLANLGKLYMSQIKYSLSEKCYLRSEKIFRKLGLKYLLAHLLVYEIDLYRSWRRKVLSADLVEEALLLAKELNQKDLLRKLSDICREGQKNQ
ncbi:tetratricopeptide repeat protein [candidate division WOR-3 bacterium]|nr:tetratricopeptide repeat protein [candidate division WOR-3 bacterium]